MATRRSELETYRGLLRECERRSDEYRRLLASYRAEQADGRGHEPDAKALKERLDTEQPELETLYKQLRDKRNGLAHARDADAAPQ